MTTQSDLLRIAESAGRQRAVMAYCRRIRNLNKQSYALAYGSWREYGDERWHNEPVTPPNLSYIAAHAVRMQIDAIRRKWGGQ